MALDTSLLQFFNLIDDIHSMHHQAMHYSDLHTLRTHFQSCLSIEDEWANQSKYGVGWHVQSHPDLQAAARCTWFPWLFTLVVKGFKFCLWKKMAEFIWSK